MHKILPHMCFFVAFPGIYAYTLPIAVSTLYTLHYSWISILPPSLHTMTERNKRRGFGLFLGGSVCVPLKY